MVSASGLNLAEAFGERRGFPRRIIGMQCVQRAFLRVWETRLKFFLGKYTRECTSCSSFHWSLFFLSKMLLEI